MNARLGGGERAGGGFVVEPARWEAFLPLMLETYGQAMSAAEFEWWFEHNPAGPRIVSQAREESGRVLGVLAMSCARMDHGLAAFAVAAATSPDARGRGVFSRLELHNEDEARLAGASWALGFTNPMAGPILVGALGWEDVTSLRLWVRPKRLRRTGRGRLYDSSGVPIFEKRHEASPRLAHQIVRDLDYLNWRYHASPRRYVRVENAGGGWAIGGHSVWHGYSALIVCDAIGADKRGLLRQLLRLADADVALAMVNPHEEAAYLATGFVPTPREIRFIGKRLTEEAPPLPKRRRDWRFTLGDLDFF